MAIPLPVTAERTDEEAVSPSPAKTTTRDDMRAIVDETKQKKETARRTKPFKIGGVILSLLTGGGGSAYAVKHSADVDSDLGALKQSKRETNRRLKMLERGQKNTGDRTVRIETLLEMEAKRHGVKTSDLPPPVQPMPEPETVDDETEQP